MYLCELGCPLTYFYISQSFFMHPKISKLFPKIEEPIYLVFVYFPSKYLEFTFEIAITGA